MVVDVQPRGGGGVARAPPPALKSVRPKLFRRASLTSWGKDNLRMTRSAAVNLKELMLTVQQQKVSGCIYVGDQMHVCGVYYGCLAQKLSCDGNIFQRKLPLRIFSCKRLVEVTYT